MRKTFFLSSLLLLTLSLVGTGCIIEFSQGTSTAQSTSTTTPSPIQPGWTPPTVDSVTVSPLTSVADVVERVRPAVVAIQTEATALDIFLRPVPERGAGSGIIIDPDGYIVTNNHVIQGAEKVTVTIDDGRTFDAEVVNGDVWTDLAVIKIGAQDLPTVMIGDSHDLRVGEWVIAIGNALALEGGPTVTAGIVSYLGRDIQVSQDITLHDLIQTDAAINPGNSGGPLLNMSAELVGINTAIAGSAQNIGFAISLTPALPVIGDLIDTGYVVRPFFGIDTVSVSPSIASRYGLALDKGVLIVAISENSPAAQSGLQIGDVITIFGGKEVVTREEIRQEIFSHEVGDEIEISYYRGETQHTTHALLAESPPPQ